MLNTKCPNGSEAKQTKVVEKMNQGKRSEPPRIQKIINRHGGLI